jgi:hypothetical protein
LIGAGRGRLRDYAAELFTIFAGIVLALLAGSTWDYSSDRRREHEYLAGIRAELDASAQELANDQRVRSGDLELLASVVDAARQRAALLDDSVPRAINALLNFRFFSPTRAVLDDLIDSGSLRLVRSDSVRFALQRYLQHLDQLAVVEERERDFIAETVEPYVATHVRMVDILPLQSYDERITSPAIDASAFHAMVRNDAFASLVFMRWERSSTAHRFGLGMALTIDQLIAVLDEALGRPTS